MLTYSCSTPIPQYDTALFPLEVKLQNSDTARLLGPHSTTILVDKIRVDGIHVYFQVPGKINLLDLPASEFTGWTTRQIRRLIGLEFVPIPIPEGLKLKFRNPKTAEFMAKRRWISANESDEVYARAVKLNHTGPKEFLLKSGVPIQAENFRGSWDNRQVAELARIAMLLPIH